ncbi:MAG: hypothetical protein M5U34_46345 [Chloroflexi bacterium]|nr:hypothetical protein [Chloroflexota bacterium]
MTHVPAPVNTAVPTLPPTDAPEPTLLPTDAPPPTATSVPTATSIPTPPPREVKAALQLVADGFVSPGPGCSQPMAQPSIYLDQIGVVYVLDAAGADCRRRCWICVPRWWRSIKIMTNEAC